MSGRLTTHVLDTALGRPAAGISLRVARGGAFVCEAVTNVDGRCDAPLLEGAAFVPGVYELMFAMGPYFALTQPGLPHPPFLDDIVLRFGVAAPMHYHVPLLVSPYGYSTYRGS
jgi:5-hydroxyisourate hydrolase